MNIIVTAMENTKNKLVAWLIEELTDKKRSQRWLARESGLSHSAVANIVSGYQPPTWGFCAAIAEPLGKHPVELFKMAGLLDEPQHGHDEPTLLHHYRSLTPAHQSAALAMLAGLAGQSAPVVEPAPAADIKAVCQLLERLDSNRLELAGIFIRWLVEQPAVPPPGTLAAPVESKRQRPPGVQRLVDVMAAMATDVEREIFSLNVVRLWEAGKLTLDGESHSEPDRRSDRSPGQGTLW